MKVYLFYWVICCGKRHYLIGKPSLLVFSSVDGKLSEVLLGDGYLETVRCRTEIRVAAFDLASLGRILAINSELIITLSRNLAAMMAVTGTETIGGALTNDNDLAEGILAGIRRTFPSI